MLRRLEVEHSGAVGVQVSALFLGGGLAKGERAIQGTMSSKDGAVKAVKRLMVSFYRR